VFAGWDRERRREWAAETIARTQAGYRVVELPDWA
jgi:hypothetical protein